MQIQMRGQGIWLWQSFSCNMQNSDDGFILRSGHKVQYFSYPLWWRFGHLCICTVRYLHPQNKLGHFLSTDCRSGLIWVCSRVGFRFFFFLFLCFFAWVLTFGHDPSFWKAAPVTRTITRCELQFPKFGNLSGMKMINHLTWKARGNCRRCFLGGRYRLGYFFLKSRH